LKDEFGKLKKKEKEREGRNAIVHEKRYIVYKVYAK